jgi:hypothetical protein
MARYTPHVSLLRMSALVRLGLAFALVAAVWASVIWAVTP